MAVNDLVPWWNDRGVRRTGWVAWWIGPGLLALAGWLATEPPRAAVPIVATAAVTRDRIDPSPLRRMQTDPPSVVIGGYLHHCNDCHRLFESAAERQGPLAQHTEVVLNHGMNDRCFNCHDRKDRQRLTCRDGRMIPFSQVADLCAQCHGTTYRDWQKGMHGKTLGSWDASTGRQHRLVCTECHNPHAPAYERIAPLPAPNTLRMGSPSSGDHGSPDGKHNPLARWRPAPGGAPDEPAAPAKEGR